MTNTNDKPLTTNSINSLKPGGELKDSGENAGLRVSCNKSGVKTIFYRYRSPLENRVKRVRIGTYAIVGADSSLPLGQKRLGLSAARVELVKLKVLRKSGVCPATELKKEKKEKANEEAKASFTVRDLVEVYLTRFIEDHPALDAQGQEVLVAGKKKMIQGKRKNIKNQRECRRTLEAVVDKTSFGEKLAASVTHVDIKNLINSLIIKGTNVQAGRVLNELSLAYTHVIGEKRPVKGVDIALWPEYLPEEQVNPCLQAKVFFRARKVKLSSNQRKRVLEDWELKRFLEWLPTSKFTPISRHALMITLLTGVRSGEAVAAVKSKFDLQAKTWLLDKTKTGVNQTVQLSTQAVEYIRPLQEKEGSIFLLPSSRTGQPQWQKQLSEQGWVLRKKGLMFEADPWTAHDLRRTVRTGLAKLGCPSEVAEACIGHSKKGLEGTYNLHRYSKECALWMQKWADHLDEIVERDY